MKIVTTNCKFWLILDFLRSLSSSKMMMSQKYQNFKGNVTSTNVTVYTLVNI